MNSFPWFSFSKYLFVVHKKRIFIDIAENILDGLSNYTHTYPQNIGTSFGFHNIRNLTNLFLLLSINYQ